MRGQFEAARELLAAARLYVISADAEPAQQARVLCAAIDGGAGIVQLRNKVAQPQELLEAARRVASHARACGAVFIVNDLPDLVAASGADGVHVGQDGGALAEVRTRIPGGAIVGRSTHSLEQARAAEVEGADYIGVGPVYATPTKPGRAAVGTELLGEVGAEVTIPWFAIGGIDAGNVAAILACGARRVAVVRAVAGAVEPAGAASALLTQLRGAAVTA